jgi:hypothetical protein
MNFGMVGNDWLRAQSVLMDGYKQPVRKDQPQQWTGRRGAEFFSQKFA